VPCATAELEATTRGLTTQVKAAKLRWIFHGSLPVQYGWNISPAGCGGVPGLPGRLRSDLPGPGLGTGFRIAPPRVRNDAEVWAAPPYPLTARVLPSLFTVTARLRNDSDNLDFFLTLGRPDSVATSPGAGLSNAFAIRRNQLTCPRPGSASVQPTDGHCARFPRAAHVGDRRPKKIWSFAPCAQDPTISALSRRLVR